MNRIKCFLIVGLLTLLLPSCNRVDIDGISSRTDANANPEIVKGAQTESEKINNNNTEVHDNPIGINYKVIDERYLDKEITIVYPQITNLDDNNKQKSINDILRSEALVVLDFYEDSKDVSLVINYKIAWQGKNILSVQYSGIANEKNAAYPLRLFYTSNININDGSKIRLKDFVKIDKGFVERFKNFKVKDPDINQASASAFNYIIDTCSEEDLIRYFEGADSSYENSAFTFSYFTKDAIGISIETPHAVGDHVEIELKYEDVKDKIRTENKIWNDFLNVL